MRIYCAGPMTGLPEHNFPAFNAETARLRALGHAVFNPAENVAPGDDVTAEEHLRRGYYMRLDILAITGWGWPGSSIYVPPVDAVVVLEGWENSRGARLEIETALQLDIQILHAGSLFSMSQAHLDWGFTDDCPTYGKILNTGVLA